MAILRAHQGIRMAAASITAGIPTYTETQKSSTEQRMINLPVQHCIPKLHSIGGLHGKTFKERAEEE